jgi:hypothetical protein
MGLLPLYRKPNLARSIRVRQMWKRTLRLNIKAHHDVSFLGAPTEVLVQRDGKSIRYNQRIEWLREVATADGPLRFWGGLALSGETQKCLAPLQQRYGDLSSIMYPDRRASFFQYFYHLCRSHVALAPAGYSRWSFRHYEALYAGAAVVSTDMSDVELLIPLPRDNMFFVSDFAPVAPFVEQAVQQHRNEPDRFESNIDFLEQYLCNGGYSRNRPLLLDRFMSQLSGSISNAAA